ncbi:MAG: hypothetical protein ACK4FJ_18545 [Ferrovibrio sp.]|uniref:hypothetical protein n=1 Tax=Ferrovibrio sp. TaxID=1917215 RepID=UPI00391C22F9
MTSEALWQIATAILIPLNAASWLVIGLLWQKLTDFRVEVARDYATNSYIKQEVDRLISQLARIEQKIDRSGSD